MGKLSLEERRARKERRREEAKFAAELRCQGLSPHAVFCELTGREVLHKEAQERSRGLCQRCWLSRSAGTCICPWLKPVDVHVPLRVIVWCHSRDYLNPVNSAGRLVALLAGEAASNLLVFGRADDDSFLCEQIARADRGKAIFLSSDGSAMNFSHFLDGLARRHGCTENSQRIQNQNGADETPLHCGSHLDCLTVVILESTGRNARTMVRYWHRNIDPHGKVPMVRLQPSSSSTPGVPVCIQQRSTAKSKCTISIVSRLLQELGGESHATCTALIRAAQLSDAAVEGKDALQLFLQHTQHGPKTQEPDQSNIPMDPEPEPDVGIRQIESLSMQEARTTDISQETKTPDYRVCAM